MTPQEAAEEAFENYWESLGFGLRDNITDEEIMPFIKAFISGTKWKSEQDNQALSSALKEIDKLTNWKNEMLKIWNKLDAYIETRKDILLGESKVDFAIKIMKERDQLHANVKQMESDLYHAECNLDISNRRVKELESKPNNFM